MHFAFIETSLYHFVGYELTGADKRIGACLKPFPVPFPGFFIRQYTCQPRVFHAFVLQYLMFVRETCFADRFSVAQAVVPGTQQFQVVQRPYDFDTSPMGEFGYQRG